MKRREFFDQLANLYAKSPNADAIKDYSEKLSSWKINSDKLKKLFDTLTERHEFYPTIADMAMAAEEIGAKPTKREVPRNWVLYDKPTVFGKARYAMICKDPSNPPTPAEDCSCLSLVIDGSLIDLRNYKACPRQEAQAEFRHGWIESGADPDKCPVIAQAVQGKSIL